MVTTLVLLTIISCIGIKFAIQRIRQTHTVEERKMRRGKWALTEEAFLKC